MVRAADSDNFLIQHTDFSLREQVNYPNGGISRFYDNGIDMVIIDENICDHNPGEPVFSYMLITDKQNSYIHIKLLSCKIIIQYINCLAWWDLKKENKL